MEGYTVMAEEMRAGFQAEDLWPTHVFLQAGVGGLAAAITSHIRSLWPHQPTITVVEPDSAACLMESHRRETLTEVTGPVLRWADWTASCLNPRLRHPAPAGGSVCLHQAIGMRNGQWNFWLPISCAPLPRVRLAWPLS